VQPVTSDHPPMDPRDHVDVTHAHWFGRLSGVGAASVLASVCAIDLADPVNPHGTTFRTLVAGIPATVIRDDIAGERSYLVLCDRSYGQYLIDTLTDAAPVWT
jgi:heterotetrameric sarcosine oxidase gamma subunit